MPDLWRSIASGISDATGGPFLPLGKSAIGGGCISDAWLLEGNSGRYFVKTGKLPFEPEALGLEAIGKIVRTPGVICVGSHEGRHWLVLEYVGMSRKIMRFDLLGAGLAELHRVTSGEFGWDRDNLIGSTAQINTPSEDWIEFWKTRRLGFQFDLAGRNGCDFGRRAEKLMGNLDAFFVGHKPAPSLLHGDLWRGNAGFETSGHPVLYDPAVYFGDREADIAMTELFGGFPQEFYSAYIEAFPLDSGYGTRKTLYNLYHVLNHLNLFGASYLQQAASMIDGLLAEIG